MHCSAYFYKKQFLFKLLTDRFAKDLARCSEVKVALSSKKKVERAE